MSSMSSFVEILPSMDLFIATTMGWSNPIVVDVTRFAIWLAWSGLGSGSSLLFSFMGGIFATLCCEGDTVLAAAWVAALVRRMLLAGALGCI